MNHSSMSLKAIGLLISLMSIFSLAPTYAATTIPTFSIVSVVPDQTVTIQTYNFPANDTFEVLMGAMGTKGINGIKVATTYSGSGGSFQATYTIPAAFQGSYQIAIRLQSISGSGYYAYNWFYNRITAATTPVATPYPPTGYSGYPTFSILNVVRDNSVTIQTYNLPPNDAFDVLMGAMGTRGVGGIKVTSINSGSGGAQQFTFSIPSALYGSYQIAIRLQSNSGSGYYAYNWFYNNTATGPTPALTQTPIAGYTGYPTFSIVRVVRDQNVTIQTYNLPPNETFSVLMGAMGTRGVGGILVTSIATGAGGSQQFTFAIPAALSGSYQIAIRLQNASGSGYYAYNWFYNHTTP